jgi:hypothetical protein
VGTVSHHLAALSSNTPTHPQRSSTRLDPYWDGVWQHGSVAQWASREHLERMEAAGISARRPKWLSHTRDEALARIDENWQMKLDLLGVLASWRTVTAEQFAAFSGRRMPDKRMERALGDMFALDLIDTGALWTPGVSGAAASRARMLRPSASNAFDQIIKPRMTFAEWVSVTSGEKFLTGGQYDRHNILTAELVLRIAEHLQVATALGERQALMADVAFRSGGAEVPPHLVNSQKAGDAVIVRADGLRIVVEVTASWSKGAERKAQMWADAMQRRPMSEAGFVVVFVIADRTNAGRGSRRSLDSEVRKSVASTVRFQPGTIHNRTANRMFVVDWRDWFPARHEVSDDFLFLAAQRPSGPNGAWQSVSLFDANALPAPTDTRALTAVAHYASGLRLVPHQLRRNRQAPNLSDRSLARLGFASIPQRLLHPRTGAPLHDATRASGAAGEAQVPERLVF